MKNPLVKMTPGVLINGSSGVPVPSQKKRLAPQPPKPRPVAVVANKQTTLSPVEDSYSTMSTVSANSASPHSTVSEKSIKVKPTRKPLPRTILPPKVETPPSASGLVDSGWVRVYCGPVASGEESSGDPNKVLQIGSSDTVRDLRFRMGLPVDFTLWLHVIGRRTRRLMDDECPLALQEEHLKRLGYQNEWRRLRMGIDPKLKRLLRFHVGPSELECCRGVLKSGHVEVLKGLVNPQWKVRGMCIVASKLVIYPGEWKILMRQLDG